MNAPKDGRTSVLAALTAEVMQDKKAAARKLTPVAGEKGAAPMAQATIPNDVGLFMSNERLHTHSQELRKFAEEAIAIADGLDAMLHESSSTEKPIDLDAERRAREAEGDAKAAEREAAAEPTESLAERMERLKAEAQAATFTPPEGAWTCPDHGKAIDKPRKRGGTYRGCPDCNKFEG